jgi:hypothetical protein
MHTKRNAYSVTKIKVRRSTRLKLTAFSAAYVQCFASLGTFIFRKSHHVMLYFVSKMDTSSLTTEF